jgi:hypothetical protein
MDVIGVALGDGIADGGRTQVMVRIIRRFPGPAFVMRCDWSVGDKVWI